MSRMSVNPRHIHMFAAVVALLMVGVVCTAAHAPSTGSDAVLAAAPDSHNHCRPASTTQQPADLTSLCTGAPTLYDAFNANPCQPWDNRALITGQETTPQLGVCPPEIILPVGCQADINMTGVTRFIVGAPSIVQAARSPVGLMVQGVRPGSTAVVIWSDNGQSTHRVRVTSAANLAQDKAASPENSTTQSGVVHPTVIVNVHPGDSQLIRGRNITRAAVSSPEVADIVPVSTTEVIVNAIKEGTTVVRVWDDNGLSTYNFLVALDKISPEEMAEKITGLIGVPTIHASIIGDTVLLSGMAPTAESAKTALTIAGACGMKVVNTISVETITPEKLVASLKQALPDQPLCYETLPDQTVLIKGSVPSLDDARRIQHTLEAWISTPESVGDKTVLTSSTRFDFVGDDELDPETADKTRVHAYEEPDQAGEVVVGEEYNFTRSVFGGRVQNGPRVVAMIDINPSLAKQILVSAQVLEINRTRLKDLGIEWSTIINGVATPLFTIIEESTNGLVDIDDLGPFDRTPLTAVVRALIDEQVARVLSEPKLLIADKHPAHILVGGEFPVPVAQQFNIGGATITVEFKTFGIQLTVLPQVAPDNRILLTLTPEVSNLNFNDAVRSADFRIPAITTRRSTTTVHMGNGETLAIGGLFSVEDRKEISKIPFLGDIPVLGELFKSRHFVRDETELVILVRTQVVENGQIVPIPLPGETPPQEQP